MKITRLRSFLDIPSLDPEDARRRKLLNILLVGLGGLSLVGLVGVLLIDITGLHIGKSSVAEQDDLVKLLYFTCIALLAGTCIVYIVNRYLSGWLASSIFLLFLAGVFILSDEPVEVVSGRSMFFFAIPILMASVLIRPYASFVATGIVTGLLSIYALNFGLTPNLFAALGFTAVAAVSWLSARSLEQALSELRASNRELDQRVAERTRELSLALTRERAEASKIQAILEGIADGVIVFDNSGKAVVANPAIGRLLNFSPGQIIGSVVERLAERMHGVDGDREKIIHLLRNPEQGTPNVRFRWDKKILLMNAAPVLEGESGRVGTVAVFRDFTHEAEVEQMKNTFLATVSHELRTPLNAIIGYSEMLRESIYGPLSERQVEVVTRIMNNNRRLLELVNDLLDQAQIDSGRLTLQNRAFSPYELLEGMHTVMDSIAADKGLELVGSIEMDLPSSMMGDARRLQQVLINLVNNAVKFTQQGTITVRIFKVDKNYWGMRVTDTGTGIPSEAQAYIFEPFRQGENAAVREHSGIGLGLSIVKRIVDMMGGVIRVNSAVGEGSTFTITLPFVPVQKESRNE